MCAVRIDTLYNTSTLSCICFLTAIYHESTIGLQYMAIPYYWLSCWGHPCNRQTCPGFYITEADHNRCGGERFRIYRASGPGIVRTGDLIGIYYPTGGSWLGCSEPDCVKASCPGSPSTAYGFQDTERWYRCYGEVFKIYERVLEMPSSRMTMCHCSMFNSRGGFQCMNT